jgi:hypothetical protein
MNKRSAIEILGTMFEYYTEAGKMKEVPGKRTMQMIWLPALDAAGFTENQLTAAVSNYVANNAWPPTLADLFPKQADPFDEYVHHAWEDVKKAIEWFVVPVFEDVAVAAAVERIGWDELV